MTIDYVNTIVAACPESQLAEGNNLAGCLGESVADLNTYTSLNYQDADGVKYCVIQFAATNSILAKADTGIAERPAYDTENQIDLALAQAGVDALYLMHPNEDGEYPAPTPGRIMYCLNTDSRVALSAMGLTPIPSGEDEL